MNPFPYKEVFQAIEQRLIEVGEKHMSSEVIRDELNKYKEYEGRDLTDDQYFSILVFVAFYSGFRAATVTAKKEIIQKHFPSWEVVSLYTDEDIKRILADPEMIAHAGKIRGCVLNAKKFGDIISKYGSIKKFIASFSPNDSFENLLLLKESLEASFSYLGGITVYHFMTDIGLSVLKPDRVICRIFERLGLLENQNQLLKTVLQGRKFSEATMLPIRYIDIVLVAYGQVKSEEIGISEGICLNVPRCSECNIRQYCIYT
ncbi:MAG: DNA-3-methyladenine glycosylase I [Gallionella sp.]|nr:DNA-3-methyladenine glycosylase I [Gallionella sp.]